MITRAVSIGLQRINPCIVLCRRVNQYHLRKLSFYRRFSSSDIEDSDEIVKSEFSLRDLLYHGSKDSTTQQIKGCKAREELSGFIEKINSLEKHQVIQVFLFIAID